MLEKNKCTFSWSCLMKRITYGFLRCTLLSSRCTLSTTRRSKWVHVTSPDKSFSPNFAIRHSICLSLVILYWKVQSNKKQKHKLLMLRRTRYYLGFILQESIRHKVSHISSWKRSKVIYKIDGPLHLSPIGFRLEAHLA